MRLCPMGPAHSVCLLHHARTCEYSNAKGVDFEKYLSLLTCPKFTGIYKKTRVINFSAAPSSNPGEEGSSNPRKVSQEAGDRRHSAFIAEHPIFKPKHRTLCGAFDTDEKKLIEGCNVSSKIFRRRARGRDIYLNEDYPETPSQHLKTRVPRETQPVSLVIIEFRRYLISSFLYGWCTMLALSLTGRTHDLIV